MGWEQRASKSQQAAKIKLFGRGTFRRAVQRFEDRQPVNPRNSVFHLGRKFGKGGRS